MHTAGIVAEFNPFHSGHAYLIKEARRMGAERIAVVMSGAAVQRGEIAVCSKHERARTALENGADLVVELPAPYSCSAAPWFASASVGLLANLGIDALFFGSEFENANLLKSAADALAALRDSENVRRLTAGGMSYPAALHEAVRTDFGEETAEVISSPNSTLAVEYIAALRRYAPRAEIVPVKRAGAGHDCAPSDGFASGSYLRSRILSGNSGEGYMPDGMPKTVCNPSAAEKIIYYRLLTADRESLMKLPEINLRLADRILKAAKNPPESYADFLTAVKSKDCTLARIRRSALHLALGATKEDFADCTVPYARILAFNRRGTEILKRADCAIPVSSSLKPLENSSEKAARISQIEMNAVRLMQMCTGVFENEYTRKISPTE